MASFSSTIGGPEPQTKFSRIVVADSSSKATKETVDLGPPHAPKEESIKAFKEIESELKKQLVHLRHDHDSRSRPSFSNSLSSPEN